MIRFLIVDDHTVVRQGVRFLLEQQPDIEIAGEAADGEQAIQAVRDQVPAVVLLDLLMPGTMV
jgi:NarL family two-component system response regulator LiaR